MVATEYVGPMPGVRSRGRGKVAADAPPESERCGLGGTGGGTPPPSRDGLYISGLLLENDVTTPVPSRGVPGRGIKRDQPLGSLYEPTHAGQNCDPGGG